MVILGGLEIIAAGYLINKHVKNKKERARIEDERQKLEEEQYHLFPPSDSRPHRHHRSQSERPDSRYHSSGRRRGDSDERKARRDSDDLRDCGRRDDGRKHSHDRRHSRERKSRRDNGSLVSISLVPPPYYKAHSVSPRPPVQQMARPVQPQQYQQPYAQPIPLHIPQSVPVINHTPPTPHAQQQYPPDIKYGWTDDTPSPQNEAQGFPPTGWPAHWEQSQRPESSARRGRSNSEGRPSIESRVRFDLPGEGEVRPTEPPPKYKA